MKNNFSDFKELEALKKHPVSGQIDEVFRSVIKAESKPKWQDEVMSAASKPAAAPVASSDEMELGDFDMELGGADIPPETSTLDEGMDLSFNEEESLDLGDTEYTEENAEGSDNYGDLSLDGELDDGLSLGDADEAPAMENLGELDFGDSSLEATPDLPPDDGLSLGDLDLGGDEEGLSLSDDDSSDALSLSDDDSAGSDLSLDEDDGMALSFGGDDDFSDSPVEADLSDDAMKKLKEIDAIMDHDASKISLSSASIEQDENLDQPLVSDDLDLGSLNFGSDDEESEEKDEVVVAPKEEKAKKKKKEAAVEAKESQNDRNYGQDLREISGAYSGEMERMQATISNLRSDRDEMQARIQKLEDEKLLQSRQNLNVRAELDEKKIELTIIRKKLNEEINDLKDRLKFFDEKKLILEEKNRLLTLELDKASQKNKMDVKKVQLREKELEQRLELLKSDAESQIRHRDLKILELKRKIDAMEFDMESISMQEKRSVESRFELEDKLEKAIKTLRGAITVLEDESDRTNALDALKKNIDM